MTYFFDYAMLSLNKIHKRNGQKAAPLLFKKGDLGITKNSRGIILTSRGAKVYHALILNNIKPDKILRKNQNSFQRNQSTTSQILTIS